MDNEDMRNSFYVLVYNLTDNNHRFDIIPESSCLVFNLRERCRMFEFWVDSINLYNLKDEYLFNVLAKESRDYINIFYEKGRYKFGYTMKKDGEFIKGEIYL